jgi:hypothetical protein
VIRTSPGRGSRVPTLSRSVLHPPPLVAPGISVSPAASHASPGLESRTTDEGQDLLTVPLYCLTYAFVEIHHGGLTQIAGQAAATSPP